MITSNYLADVQREMKMLEENIKLWSSGKERNIELLLSTLQDVRQILKMVHILDIRHFICY